MTAPFAVVVNPASGEPAGREGRTERLRRRFAEAGLEADIHPTGRGRSPGEAARAAVRSGAATVVAAGGDGTVSGVADALVAAPRPARLGVVPLGTFNYFARGLGLPLDEDRAIAVLAGGHLREVHPGCVNGRVFLNNMSLGLYPSILERREGIYARWGRSRIAAYWSVVLALAGMQRPMRLSLTLDGRTRRLRTPLLFVARSAFQLETYNLEGAEAVRAGGLAVFAASGTRRRDLARAALALARGKPERGDHFALGTARRLVIGTGRSRSLVARDGEREWMQTPLRVAPARSALDVHVPQEDAG
ncbi:diacylglycerol/lipid kinase family protein [Rhodosalinus sp.]|uniref:diacylglycerol/lipid kinase family protein n=1 Tax=Rhodosalinus sp. TaxID=2047741 RepID=UPI00397C4376